jgi:hypothetical protein
MGGKYFRNALYTCMKIAQWNPPETVKKEGGRGKAVKEE